MATIDELRQEPHWSYSALNTYLNKHRCINFYINKFQIPSPTLRGVAKRPLILADMTFLTRLRSSEIPPLIVLAA